jgi:hypothetical protein
MLTEITRVVESYTCEVIRLREYADETSNTFVFLYVSFEVARSLCSHSNDPFTRIPTL